MWQALYEELREYGFVVVTVALDQNVEDPRPYIDAAQPTHPSLIDTEHLLADLYHIVNVPSVFWIDEQGQFARPRDIAFGSDTFKDFTGIDSAPHIEALKQWVRTGRTPFTQEEIIALQMLPDADTQRARAEFAVAWHLHQLGEVEAAAVHFDRAGEIAPHDFTIRRGSMPIRGKDPMGAEFFDLYAEWTAAGKPGYRSLK